MGRKTIKRKSGKRHITGQDFRLADEIRYIQGRAAEHDGRFVTVGPLALFSADTDAWLLNPEDHLAAGMAIRKMSTSTRRIRGSRSAGEANIESTATLSCYLAHRIAEWIERKFQISLARLLTLPTAD